MGMGVAGMIITSDYESFPHSLLSTSKYFLHRPRVRVRNIAMLRPDVTLRGHDGRVSQRRDRRDQSLTMTQRSKDES